MIVNFVHVLLHLAGQRGSHFAAARLASQMSSISVELRFEIDKYGAPRSKFIVGNGLLKLSVAFVDARVESGRIEMFSWHGEFVDEPELKIPEALNLCVASAFYECRSATAGKENRKHVQNSG